MNQVNENLHGLKIRGFSSKRDLHASSIHPSNKFDGFLESFNKIEPFTKKEIKSILIIFAILFLVTAFNMNIAIRKGRDSTRKNDISAIQKYLESYMNRFGSYPPSDDQGRIVGCFDGEPILDPISNSPTNNITCEYGVSYFEDSKALAKDPKSDEGRSYRYEFDGKNYWFYIALEGRDEAEYSQEIVDKGLSCGTKICNYGRGS